MIVTLDGPSGVGKTSLAQRVAGRLGIAYLDTGAMFRGVAWTLGEGAWQWEEARIREALDELCFSLRGVGAETALLLNGTPLTEAIRTEIVGMWASHMARLSVVRAALKEAQQALGATHALLAEGRDMGSVVFPRARYKFFLDASPEVRARRRWDQLRAMGREEDLAVLTEQMRMRDEQDRSRSIAPLKPAPDAEIIDTGGLTLEDVFERICSRF
jgi:cytidylate kinase